MVIQRTVVVAAMAWTGIAWAQPEPSDGLGAAISAIELSADDLVTVQSYGRSLENRPLRVVRLGAGDSPDDKPGIAIIAGLDGRHQIGPRVAVSLIAEVIGHHRELLDSATLYVLPAANPDGLIRWREDSPRLPGVVGSPVPDDADDDRHIDEDGPLDLDGDGHITMMRVEDPDPGTGLTAQYVIDEDDPRIVRHAKDDERATHALVIEGRDQDRDGSIAEDGPGGVDLDRNFPYRWEEFAEGVGEYPLSEPETRALADWMLSRPNLYTVVVYSPGDTVVKIPDADRMDETGRIPTGILREDQGIYEALSEAFKEATGQTGAPGAGEGRGSLQRWAYAHLGLASVSTPIWVRPDLVSSDDDQPEPASGGGEAEGAGEGESDTEAERRALIDQGVPERIVDFLTADHAGRTAMGAEFESMSQSERREMMQQMMALPEDVRARVRSALRGGGDPAEAQQAARSGSGQARGRSKPSGEDAAWLEVAEDRDEGFVEWREFDHPDLGRVEIGGFVPGFKLSVPETERARLVDEQAMFLASLVGMLPKLESDLRVERLGQGLWRVRLRVTNVGDLPTRTAMGVRARRLAPVRIWIDLDDERVVAGDRRQGTWSIAGRGGAHDAEWIVSGQAGERVGIDITSEVLGHRRVVFHLEEDRR